MRHCQGRPSSKNRLVSYLKDFLDGDHFAGFTELSLVDHTEASISDDLEAGGSYNLMKLQSLLKKMSSSNYQLILVVIENPIEPRTT